MPSRIRIIFNNGKKNLIGTAARREMEKLFAPFGCTALKPFKPRELWKWFHTERGKNFKFADNPWYLRLWRERRGTKNSRWLYSADLGNKPRPPQGRRRAAAPPRIEFHFVPVPEPDEAPHPLAPPAVWPPPRLDRARDIIEAARPRQRAQNRPPANRWVGLDANARERELQELHRLLDERIPREEP